MIRMYLKVYVESIIIIKSINFLEMRQYCDASMYRNTYGSVCILILQKLSIDTSIN